MKDRIMRAGELAALVGVKTDTVRHWRRRYDDFPEPAQGDANWPWYSEREFTNWFVSKWPHRSKNIVRWLHQFTVTSMGSTHRVAKQGSHDQVLAYMQVTRDLVYADWNITSSSTGFLARKDGETHIWAIDVEKPEEWFVYEQRFLATGKKK